MDYCSDDGEEFSIAVFDGTNMKFGVDTEDAEVESVDIQGEEGIMASKNGIIQIAWANQKFFLQHIHLFSIIRYNGQPHVNPFCKIRRAPAAHRPQTLVLCYSV